MLNHVVPAFGVAERDHSHLERIEPRNVDGWLVFLQKSNAPDLALLLGERAEWRCERSPSKRNEKLAAIVHSPPSGRRPLCALTSRSADWRVLGGLMSDRDEIQM